MEDSITNSQSSESSQSSGGGHESKEERAARIRQNQRRCRERKLAYVASLEDRLRVYESHGVQANIQLQKSAKKFALENKKLRRALFETLGIVDKEIDEWEETRLIEEIRARTKAKDANYPGGYGYNGFIQDGIGLSSGAMYTPRPVYGSVFPSAPVSDIRSSPLVVNRPAPIPTPPPTQQQKEDTPFNNGSKSLIITLAPESIPECGKGLSKNGKEFCKVMNLLAPQTCGTVGDAKTVTCHVTYEALRSIIDEQDGPAIRKLAIELSPGLDGDDGSGHGCRVDTHVLSKIMDRMNSKQGEMMLVDA